jgi:hypothetical protein
MKLTKKDKKTVKGQILNAMHAMWIGPCPVGPGYLECDYIMFDILKNGDITAKVRGRRLHFKLVESSK